MDFSRAQLRRSLREADRGHATAMAATSVLVDHVLSGDADLSQADKAEVLLGSMARRRFLAIGGFSVGMAAVLAACGKAGPKDAVPQAGATKTTDALATHVVSDVVLLRTASSLEHAVVTAYDQALALGVFDAGVTDAVKLFQSHHREHAAFFEKTTTDAGGKAFTTENPVVLSGIIAPSIATISSSKGDKVAQLVSFAYALEMIAAGTYQSFVASLSAPALRSAVASVSGVEARHAAILAALTSSAAVPELAKAAVTVTTVAGATAPATAPVIFQVPAAFSSLSAAQALVGDKVVGFEMLGPNSFTYDA